MRAGSLALLLASLALFPAANAEWGAYDEHDYPLNVEGESTYPGRAHSGAEGPVNEVAGITLYPYYPVLTAEMQRLASEHPDLVKLHSAGKSSLGLDLWMLEIADFGNPDGKPLDEREVVWVDGGTHSNEYSGVYFTAHLASFLLDGYGANDTATWIVENRHTFLMPLVNPDGSHAMGRLNAHAVNINRNYPVGWGALAESPVLNNPGPSPASEVETQVNIEWFNKTRPDLYVSVHCCANLWLYPYGIEGIDPPDKAVFERVCDEAFPTVREGCGPIWSTIYPASGSSVDTVYEYAGAVAWGYEMSGRGALALWGQPFTTEDVEVQEVESWEGLLHGFLNVHKYGARPEVRAARVDGDALELHVANVGWGNLTEGTLTLVSGEGLSNTVDLPPIPAGASGTVRMEGKLAAGAHALAVEWVKREMAAPKGRALFPLLLEEGAFGRLTARLPDAPGGGSLSLNDAEPEERGAPVPAAGVLAGGLAGALLIRRRHRARPGGLSPGS